MIDIEVGAFMYDIIAHELKHAYQFETGEISFGLHENGFPFYDITDEIEAYKRNILFDGEVSEDYLLKYNHLQKEHRNVLNYPTDISSPKGCQGVANNQKCVFRWKGQTYIGSYFK